MGIEVCSSREGKQGTRNIVLEKVLKVSSASSAKENQAVKPAQNKDSEADDTADDRRTIPQLADDTHRPPQSMGDKGDGNCASIILDPQGKTLEVIVGEHSTTNSKADDVADDTPVEGRWADDKRTIPQLADDRRTIKNKPSSAIQKHIGKDSQELADDADDTFATYSGSHKSKVNSKKPDGSSVLTDSANSENPKVPSPSSPSSPSENLPTDTHPKVKVGDRVRYVGPMIKYRDWVGTVKVKVYGSNYSIEWDNGKKTESIPVGELMAV
jgi:hypothetical protein